MQKLPTQSKSTTPVQILARVQFKNNPKHVTYRCLSSDGHTVYSTFVFAGKVTSCDCPSRKPCKHMAACQAKEDARQVETVAAIETRNAYARYSAGYYD